MKQKNMLKLRLENLPIVEGEDYYNVFRKQFLYEDLIIQGPPGAKS